RLVQIVDVSAVVLAVVKADRRARDHGGECIFRIRQRRQREWAAGLRQPTPCSADRSERAGGQCSTDQPATGDPGPRGGGGRYRCVCPPEGRFRSPASLPQDSRQVSANHWITSLFRSMRDDPNEFFPQLRELWGISQPPITSKISPNVARNVQSTSSIVAAT